MRNGSSLTPEGAIPGWRVIVSDAGRFWASRVEPFPAETEWHAPPYRTVDGDTFDELRAEVERQEEVAGRLEAACGLAAEQAGDGRTVGSGGEKATSKGTSGRVGR